MNLPYNFARRRMAGFAHHRAFLRQRRRKAALVAGIALALTGLSMVTGRRRVPGSSRLKVGNAVGMEERLTINRSPLQVYLFWRNLGNLPRFMPHLESVEVISEKRSIWTGITSAQWEV